jgi:hypothetical protein
MQPGKGSKISSITNATDNEMLCIRPNQDHRTIQSER